MPSYRPLSAAVTPLEARTHLSAKGTIPPMVPITGTNGDDVITVEQSGDASITVTINGSSELIALPSGKSTLLIDGRDGNDRITNLSHLESTINGSDGNDTLTGGLGDDLVVGGAGDDTLRYSGGGTDRFDGGDGIDLADYSDSQYPMHVRSRPDDIAPFLYAPEVHISPRANLPDVKRDWLNGLTVEQIRCTPFNDGFQFDQKLHNFPDFTITVFGGAGDDYFDAGSDMMVIFAEDGNDFFYAGPNDFGEMTCNGGAGNDTLTVTDPAFTPFIPGDGIDALNLWQAIHGLTVTLDANSPEQVIAIASYDEFPTTIVGDSASTLITAEWPGSENFYQPTTSPIIVRAGGGDDTIIGGAGADTLEGEAGRDSIDGGGGDDSITGGEDSDTLRGGLGADHLSGGDGDDFLIADDDPTPDTYHGGAGIDRLIGVAAADDLVLGVERFVPTRDSRIRGSGAGRTLGA